VGRTPAPPATAQPRAFARAARRAFEAEGVGEPLPRPGLPWLLVARVHKARACRHALGHHTINVFAVGRATPPPRLVDIHALWWAPLWLLALGRGHSRVWCELSPDRAECVALPAAKDPAAWKGWLASEYDRLGWEPDGDPPCR
jgi:hypothetical protein